MPAKHKQLKITVTAEEDELFSCEAKRKEKTVSNLIRLRLKLPELERGARKGNQNARRERPG